MNEQIREIAKRLYGLRDALNVPASEMAAAAGVSEADYLAYESGNTDIPIGVLQTVARHYHVELTALLFGEEPTVSGYYLTRAGQGTAMERVKAYKYQSLAAGFARRLADPFIVTVDPKPDDEPIHMNSHPGQEFNYVLEGALQLTIGGRTLILRQGDSLYFDSSRPHGMKALNGLPVRFLAVIL